MRNREQDTSIFISLILRHKPQVIGIQLDKHGYANVPELIQGIQKTGRVLDTTLLEKIVAEDKKQRYSFNEDHSLIRANQGHSIPVDVELNEVIPPEILYHGTAEKSREGIFAHGILKQSREYVHLSADTETAVIVGKRHGTPVILSIDAAQMSKDGYPFYLSANQVWLTKMVPAQYLKRKEG